MFHLLRFAGIVLVSLPFLSSGIASGKDYFLTIAGGYSPRGNQASMEANVLFFEQVLAEKSDQVAEHLIFFADGTDPEPDVQERVTVEGVTEAERFLAEVFDWDVDSIIYRNSQLAAVDGRNHPRDVREGLRQLVGRLAEGDRLFVYVTAHGGPAEDDEDSPYHTRIHGWDDSSFDSERFTHWIESVPPTVPVVMVMAQCYCGGFAHAIYRDADPDQGLAEGTRVGFFAQQHDLPAAGCRPDISNDEEYSSYFWGALVGRSRIGTPIDSADLDGDGAISFSEAHAYAVLASPTIDIPLRASETILREYVDSESLELTGTLAELVAEARPVDRAMVVGLAEELGFALEDDITKIVDQISQQRRSGRRGGRDRVGRRTMRRITQTLREEILNQWPELEQVDSFDALCGSPLDRQQVYDTVQQWPAYERYMEAIDSRREAQEESESRELRETKLRRLMQTLETIALAERLPDAVDAEIVQRYQEMLRVEDSTL